MTPKDFLTTGEAAKLVEISRSTISRNFDKGIFQGKKNPITGERFISRESLISFLKQYNLPFEALVQEKKRIVVGTADDHLFSFLQMILSDDDRVEIERALFGGDVLVGFSRKHPDLLILDEELSDIPSAEVIRSLRRMEDLQGLKIICFANGRNTRKCVEWGADEAFSKEDLKQGGDCRDPLFVSWPPGGSSGRRPELQPSEAVAAPGDPCSPAAGRLPSSNPLSAKLGISRDGEHQHGRGLPLGPAAGGRNDPLRAFPAPFIRRSGAPDKLAGSL